MCEILTIDELAQLLKMSRTQVYTLTRKRSQKRMENPVPMIKINGNIRFRRSDIESWLNRIASGELQ